MLGELLSLEEAILRENEVLPYLDEHAVYCDGLIEDPRCLENGVDGFGTPY